MLKNFKDFNAKVTIVEAKGSKSKKLQGHAGLGCKLQLVVTGPGARRKNRNVKGNLFYSLLTAVSFWQSIFANFSRI